jgi:phosphoadenosine phosphosulfate reductase
MNGYMREQTNIAIKRIETAHEIATGMGDDLVLAYSGGKDSDVLLDLALKSGVPFRAEHNHTTMDAPQTVYRIREAFARLDARGIPCKINMPETTIWELVPKKLMPPTRLVRYCCAEFKERRFANQHLMFGVRWAESTSRAARGLHEKLHAKAEKRIAYADENDDGRKLTEICGVKNRIVTNPIIDWTDGAVWRYMRDNDIVMNPLYAMGFRRVGCIGCPMASKRERLREFVLFPKYKDMWLRAFSRMLDVRKERGKETEWKTAEDVFRWWVDPDHNPAQIEIDFGEENEDE